jgi:hypothetical protein
LRNSDRCRANDYLEMDVGGAEPGQLPLAAGLATDVKLGLKDTQTFNTGLVMLAYTVLSRKEDVRVQEDRARPESGRHAAGCGHLHWRPRFHGLLACSERRRAVNLSSVGRVPGPSMLGTL